MTPTPAAESSPANPHFTVEAPQGDARAEWLKTGAVPEDKPKTEESASSKEHSAEGQKPEEKGAPASEAGKEKQETRGRSNAETRLNEVLEDLRRAGLSPSELKTFKREQQQRVEPEKAPEHTAKPTETALKPPVKPKAEDFEGKPWAEYEAAKDKYFEDLADYKVKVAVEEDRAARHQAEQKRDLEAKLTDATKRYGAEAENTITRTAGDVFGDAKVNGTVKQMLNDSPVLVDLLYVLGSKPEDLNDFLGDARSNPGAAIRKLVLVEKLVLEELAKGGTAAESDESGTQRDETGKFAKATPAEKKPTGAPPPPKEVSGRSAAPPDEVEQALATGDARAAIDAMNRADLRKRKGL
jgi:hypothetical protein